MAPSILTAVARAATINIINNPSAETASSSDTPIDWQANSWGANTSTLTYTTTGHTGNRSLYASLSNTTNGDAKWIPTSVPVTPGQTYDFSDYAMSNVATEVDLQYTDNNGATSYVYLTPVAANSSWTVTNASFTVPANIARVSVLHIIATNGWLQTDDYTLSVHETPVLTPAPTPVPTPTPTPAPTPVPSSDGNLVLNGDFEQANGAAPLAWSNSTWGTNSASFAYHTTGHSGSHSAKVSISSYTSGDAKWVSTPVSVTAGKTYSYSNFYQSTVASRVVVAYTTSANVTSYQELDGATPVSAWAQYNANFTAPTGAASATVFHLLSSAGTLAIDDVDIRAATPAPIDTTTTVPNSSVEVATASGTSPKDWQTSSWGTNTGKFAYVATEGHTGTHSLKVTVSGYINGDAKWFFTPTKNLKPGQTYRFTSWYKTNTAPKAVSTYTDTAGVTKYFNMTNILPAANSSTVWQQYTSVFTVPTNAIDFTVFMLLSSNGWLQTDDLSLVAYTPAMYNQALVSLTFDDGWQSIYNNALPLLSKYNLPSTQYVMSGSLNAPGYMTTNMVKAFKAQGSEIAAHTVTHADLTTLTVAKIDSELSQSKATIQQLFGIDMAKNFATPYGSYNTKVLTEVKKYYKSHRSTDVGYNSKDNFDPYNIVVQNVESGTTPAEVQAWVNHAIATKTWLVLVYHNVDNSGYAYSVSPANLDNELSYIKSTGVSVKTLDKAFDEVSTQL